jgi:hypothetical protein
METPLDKTAPVRAGRCASTGRDGVVGGGGAGCGGAGGSGFGLDPNIAI